MRKLISTAVLGLALAGAVAPAFAASYGDPEGYGPYADPAYHTGGDANDYYGARGAIPAQDVHAQKWGLCEYLYPTFNPATGTFVGEDGLTYHCQ